MIVLSFENVKRSFMRALGMSAEEFEHGDLLEQAEARVLACLSVSPEEISEVQIGFCEYAAASAAVYMYCYEDALRRADVMDESGAVRFKREDRETIDTAREMVRNAMKLLEVVGISCSSDFAFIDV